MADEGRGFPVGTPGYIPPETWVTNKWYPRGDIFSMAVTVLQVIIDRVPEPELGVVGIFQEVCNVSNQAALMEAIAQLTSVKHPPLHLMPPQLHGLAQLLACCLDKDRNRRPRAPQALADRWLSGNSSPVVTVATPGMPVTAPVQVLQQQAGQAGAPRPVALGVVPAQAGQPQQLKVVRVISQPTN